MQELLFGNTGGPSNSQPQQQAPPQPAVNSNYNNNNNNTANDNNLRPSTNSAFEKYVPSTADINTKMNSKTSYSSDTSPFVTAPRRSDSLKGAPQSNWESISGPSVTSPQQKLSHVNFNPLVSSSLVGKSVVGNGSSSTVSSNGNASRAKSPKVARFCHECGNPFALPNIRFCCECGVKRLYC